MKRTAEGEEFIAQSVFRMEESRTRIAACLQQLNDQEIWQRPNAHSNSTGNLILHLCGNITQYIISSLGSRPDSRNRDAEFMATSGYTRKELSDQINSTITDAINVIRQLSSDELTRVREVQGFSLTGTGVILHVVEHLSYHTGQIAFWTKLLKDKDLDFYKGVDLNVKNKTR